MDEPGFFNSYRIAILGLGLMGGSMAMDLRGRCAALMAVDPNPLVRPLAQRWGVVDVLVSHPHELPEPPDLVILAAPVRTNIRLLAELGDLFPDPAVVLDLGSTKTEVVRSMAELPERFDPLGGHPMCGKEHSSLAYAESGLYHEAPFALTPLERTSEHARKMALRLVQLLGARALWLGPQVHDAWVSSISHVPFLLSNTLAAVTPPDATLLVGPGFRSTARLAPSDPDMILDILETNRENVLEGLDGFRTRLDEIDAMIRADDVEGLREAFKAGAINYHRLIGHQTGGDA